MVAGNKVMDFIFSPFMCEDAAMNHDIPCGKVLQHIALSLVPEIWTILIANSGFQAISAILNIWQRALRPR